jgi:hypothetical protein
MSDFTKTLPFQAHSATSREAAKYAKEFVPTQKLRVLMQLQIHDATDEELHLALRMNPSTQRPRRIELVQAGKVRDSGRIRNTKSGRRAVVWEVIS